MLISAYSLLQYQCKCRTEVFQFNRPSTMFRVLQTCESKLRQHTKEMNICCCKTVSYIVDSSGDAQVPFGISDCDLSWKSIPQLESLNDWYSIRMTSWNSKPDTLPASEDLWGAILIYHRWYHFIPTWDRRCHIHESARKILTTSDEQQSVPSLAMFPRKQSF